MLAVLLGCGLRRSEVAAITLKHIQQRDSRWYIVDLVGKHGRVRTMRTRTLRKRARHSLSARPNASPKLRRPERGYQQQAFHRTLRPLSRASRYCGAMNAYYASSRASCMARSTGSNMKMEDLAVLGPFLQKRLKPELDAQKVSLGQRTEEIHAQLASLTKQITAAESELHKIADTEFKRNWDLITKLLDQVQALAMKMDHNMIEAGSVGIQVRSHEARVVMFGEQYVAGATGYIIQPGSGE